jgi:hypothetical protein
MMILVQGFGAPTNMIVGVERFAGITGGLPDRDDRYAFDRNFREPSGRVTAINGAWRLSPF